MPPRYRWALLVVALVAGCGRPPLADTVVGAWTIQSINGKAVPERFRDQVSVAFFRDGTFQREGDNGTYEVVDDATIRTRLGDLVEAITVEVAGDTLTMRTAEGFVTVMARVRQ